jgi:hypothetical protein
VAWLEGDVELAASWWRRCLEISPADPMARGGLDAIIAGQRPPEPER